MGMDQRVTFSGPVPAWLTVATFLTERGYPVQMRMIDGELAFPDEVPPDSWREIRVASTQGMVTLRRQEAAITLVTWGNADGGMRQLWNALAWALAAVGRGSVMTEAGPVAPEAFAKSAELPPGLRVQDGQTG